MNNPIINDNDRFLQAFRNKEIDEIKNLININNINTKDKDGYYPLILAIKSMDIEVINTIIDYANNNKVPLIINQKAKAGQFPLLSAINSNNIKIVKKLIAYAKSINKTLDINEKDENEYFPLLRAIENNNFDIVKELIDYSIDSHIDLNVKDINKKYKNSPIIKALNNKSIEIIKLLISYAKDKNLFLSIPEEYIEVEIFSEFSDELKELLYESYKENIIEIIFKHASKNKKIFKKLTQKEREINFKEKGVVFDDFINKIHHSIILIEVDEGETLSYGTGFIIKYNISLTEEVGKYFIITNNHILNENHIKSPKSFRIYINNDYIEYSINNQDFVFTSELIDITIIELNNKTLIDNKDYILEVSSEDAKENESVLLYQFNNKYKNNNNDDEFKIIFSHGNMISMYGFNLIQEAVTYNGSSGAPIFNEYNLVVGVHKAKNSLKNNDIKNVNKNLGTKFSEIKKVLDILYSSEVMDKYNAIKARESAKKLSEEELKKLNDKGLQLVLSDQYIKNRKSKYLKKGSNEKLYKLELLKKSLFKYSFSENLLFYRTNYAWYITMLSEKEENYKYNLSNLSNLSYIKELDWIIISNSDKSLDKVKEIIRSDSSPGESDDLQRKKIELIEWLISTKLDFLMEKKKKYSY